jgi:hypothetical protein
VKSVFGNETQILGYSGIHDNTLCFEEPTEPTDKIWANVPYLIKPGPESKDKYEFDGSTISYSTYSEPNPTEISAKGERYNQYYSEFVGTYKNQKIPVDAYYLKKDDKFYYMPSENTTKGWKAYSGVVIINPEANGSAAARPSAAYLEANINAGEPTGIDAPTPDTIESISLEGPM